MTIYIYLLAKIGFDTAENEPSKVWTCLPAPSTPLIQLRMTSTSAEPLLAESSSSKVSE